MKKAVLFDLDNTLYDYEPVHKKALDAVFNILRKEVKITREEFGKLYKISKAEIHRELSGTASAHNRVLYFQRLIEKTHNTIEPDKILRLYNTYWDTSLRNMKLKKGVLQVLKKLKEEKIKTGIVTDLTTDIQLKKISRLGITDYVDFLVSSEEAGREKPNPAMFLLVLNKMRVLPEDALMVGDNPDKDIEGANSVGIDTVLLPEGKVSFRFKEDYQKPTYVVKDISEILGILGLNN